jgi:hypothetical protein
LAGSFTSSREASDLTGTRNLGTSKTSHSRKVVASTAIRSIHAHLASRDISAMASFSFIVSGECGVGKPIQHVCRHHAVASEQPPLTLTQLDSPRNAVQADEPGGRLRRPPLVEGRWAAVIIDLLAPTTVLAITALGAPPVSPALFEFSELR